jgi:hypothetical protein
MEEIFFFQYHLRMSRRDCMSMPIHERRWMVERFIQQKEKEQEQMKRTK